LKLIKKPWELVMYPSQASDYKLKNYSMRKILTLIAGTMITGTLLAGGLVTNTNQSASWVRMPSRNASVEIDAVYFNPAGLMKLENGFHFGLNNQTISQTREITNDYSGPGGLYGLNQNTYEGKVFSWYFPSVYAAFKLDKLAFSVGFMPIGGGGGAEYKKGLPSFEMGISDLVPGLASQGATGYDVDIYFEGSSTWLGYQGAVSYKINDMISVAAGARYVTAKNTYSGHLRNVQVMMGETMVNATDVFAGIATNLGGIIGIPASLADAINEGFGSATLQNLVDAEEITAVQKAAIEQGLLYIGVSSEDLPTLSLNAISGTVTAATPALTTTRNEALATGPLVADKSADVTQTGSGFAPFFSVNISPIENLNIAIKYEMATKLELVNETKEDLLIGYTATGVPITQFPNGEKTRSDIPAMLTVGVDFRIADNLKVAAGANYFFDKSADYGHKIDADLFPPTPATPIANSEIIDHNGLSMHGGLEFNLSDNLLVSAGYSYANKGVNSLYQSDMTFGNSTNTVGFGGAYIVNDKVKINLGANYTMYAKDSKTVDHMVKSGITYINFPATETYVKNTLIVGIGLDLSF
jgi:long-subunit fatty acid transport protein